FGTGLFFDGAATPPLQGGEWRKQVGIFMQRHRVLMAFGIAWLSALLLSWWVYKRTTAPQSRDLVSVVAAARDLPIGKRILAEDLKSLSLDRKDLPKGVFLKGSDLVDRSVAVPVIAGEVVLNGKLTAKGSGEGLTALIDRKSVV